MIHSAGHNIVAAKLLPVPCVDTGSHGAPKVFIPITDELLFERPELITSPLVPYQIDHPCFHWLSIEIEEIDIEEVDAPCRDAA